MDSQQFAVVEEVRSSVETVPAPRSQDSSIQTITSVQQARKDQEKILKAFNTPSYRLLEYGAQTMLWYEDVVDKVQHLVSTDTIVDGLSNLSSIVTSYFTPVPKRQKPKRESNMDSIQQQLDFVMQQMAAVQEDNQRKNEELKRLKSQIASVSGPSSPKQRPVPPPFPPELASYTQASERNDALPPQTIASPVIQARRPPPSPMTPVEKETTPVKPNTQNTVKPASNSQSSRPPLFLSEIQEASRKVKLRKVPRNEDGTPIRDKNKASVREPSVNDEIRQRMRKRIQMMEDSDPEEDVK
ncbi:hypothetical protein WA556_004012, partial [Blastocystis sp. ATCC 50177/Nand II]